MKGVSQFVFFNLISLSLSKEIVTVTKKKKRKKKKERPKGKVQMGPRIPCRAPPN